MDNQLLSHHISDVSSILGAFLRVSQKESHLRALILLRTHIPSPIASVARYNAPDIFSGRKDRVLRALEALEVGQCQRVWNAKGTPWTPRCPRKKPPQRLNTRKEDTKRHLRRCRFIQPWQMVNRCEFNMALNSMRDALQHSDT